jgi:sugar lactone lactonase YvrE
MVFCRANLVQSGANSTLALSGVSTNDAGNYTVVVTNNYGSATSQVAMLTVVLPPTVAILPASQTNMAGTTASFSVTASGVGPFAYQWQLNGTNLPNNIITTVAGNGTNGFSGDNGAATNARLYHPTGLAFDSTGNLFIADQSNNRIRKVDTNGIITTVAGKSGSGSSGDGGAATNASLNSPQTVGFDAAGNLYIAGYTDCRVRKVDASGIITTVAGNGAWAYSGDGGWAISASLNHPTGVTFDASGNMYISDCWNNRVRKVDANGIITTVAGKGTQGFSGDGGTATNASLSNPYAVAFDVAGNMYIPDWQNNRIRKVATNGIITTVAGGGSGGDGGLATNASLNQPQGVAFDAFGNLYIADWANSRVRKVANNGIISTVVGNGSYGYSGDGGAATKASLNEPPCIVFDIAGNMFIADWQNNRVREVHFAGFPTLLLANVSATNAGYYSVVITSPYGSVTSAVATLTVITPPQIIASGTNFGFTINLANQSGFGFNISGTSNQTIVVDGSTNLLDWTPLYTNTANGAPAYFFDLDSTNYPGRFYRARLQ